MALLEVEDEFRIRRRVRRKPVGGVLSARDLSPDYVDEICELSDIFEYNLDWKSDAAGAIVSLLFFQPSTRTRLGFEASAVTLGCHPIGLDDMAMSRSNARTGESLEDCAAVVSSLCDAIVVRHHEVGAAARMASRSSRPVINAGDGWNEHPTQALIDIYSMRRGLGSLRGKSIAFGGDPRGRTVRSLVLLLRYEAPSEVVFCPPPSLPVPEDLLSVLAMHQIRVRVIADITDALRHCDAIMMAPYDMSDIGEAVGSDYVSPRLTPDSHVVNLAKLEATRSRTLLFHPLPRQDEISPDCDDTINAMYFEQVRLSKFVRMAVLDRALTSH